MEEIYKEYSKIVYNYLLSITNDAELSEELMQETFYSAVKNIDKYRHEASMKTWLCKIAKNKWLYHYKTKKKQNEINIDELDEKNLYVNSFEEEFENRQDILDLYKKIHKLDEKTREVIYLRLKAELTFKEIGQILGESEVWVRVTFYRAKAKLKEEFENE